MDTVLSGFEPLLRQAKEALEADPSAEQAVAVSTAGGALRCFVNHAVMAGSRDDEAAFVKALAEGGDTRVLRMACVWKDLAPDLPSHALRGALLELDPANGAAEILLRTAEGYTAKTIEATMG